MITVYGEGLVDLVPSQNNPLSPLVPALGGLAIGLLGAVASKKADIPRITTTVPASVIMIPGPAMFGSVYALTSGNIELGVDAAATAVMTVLAIGAGLVTARMLTDRDWVLGRYIDLDKPLAGAEK